MLIAQALGEFGMTTALVDAAMNARFALEDYVNQVDPATWFAVVVGAAAIWLLFVRR